MNLQEIAQRFEGVRWSGDDRFTCKCPGHDDQHASLSVGTGEIGVQVFCHVCREKTENVLAAVGLTFKDLMNGNGNAGKPINIVATYSYPDEQGHELYQMVRLQPKDFRARRSDGNGGWIWNLKDVPRVLYRLPELLQSKSDIFITEGEKDVDRLRSLGLTATCNPGGAGKWREDYNRYFRGQHVTIVPDNDPPGKDHAQNIARNLHGIAASIKIVSLPLLKEKGDVSDYLDSGGTVEDLVRLTEAAPVWTPKTETQVQTALIEAVPVRQIMEAANHPVEWLIRPLQPVKSVGMLVAPGKETKTTTTLALSLLSIKGGNLAGHFDSTGGHSVAWFDAENSIASWGRKYLSICRGFGEDPQGLMDSGRFTYFNKRGLYLDQPSVLEAVIEAAKNTCASIIVLDSLTRIHRQKENDAIAMSSFFVDSIFRLRDEACAGVIILHHTRKPLQGYRDNPADAGRGTVDLRNVVDTHLSLSRNRKDRSIFSLTVSAQRDANEEGPFHWRLDWTDEKGVRFEKVETPEADTADPNPPWRPPKASQACRTIIGEAITKDPTLTQTTAVQLCVGAGWGTTTAKNIWRELKRD